MKKYFISQHVISSSFDTIRNSVGGFWKFSTVQDEYDLAISQFVPLNEEEPQMGPHFVAAEPPPTANGNIKFVKFDAEYATTASSELLVPSIKIPVRLYGNAANIENDEHWRKVVLGGTYGAHTHAVAFSSELLWDNSFEIELPYDPQYIKQNDPDNASTYSTFSFSYDYNYYLKKYQNLLGDYTHFELPNYYFILSQQQGLSDDENSDINEFVSRHGNYETGDLLSTNLFQYPPLYDIDSSDVDQRKITLYTDREHNLRSYLTSSMADTMLSGGLVSLVSSTCKNYIFNRQSQTNLFLPSYEYKEVLPFYTKLHIPVKDASPGVYYNIIEDAGCETILLNSIKERFVDNRDLVDIEIMNSLNSYITSSGIEVDKMLINTLPNVNLFTLMLNSITDSNSSRRDNFQIMGGQGDLREKIVNQGGTFRYAHTIPAMKTLANVNFEILKDHFYQYGGSISEPSDFFNTALTPRSSEVLAYRIRKIEGEVDVDFGNPKQSYSAPREESIQNFIFSKNQTSIISSENSDGITIYDTQVKYGQSYTYTCYAYVLVVGYKYSYRDIVISKQISYQQLTYAEMEERDIPMSYYVASAVGEENLLGDYCLSFYDPATEEASPYLVMGEYESSEAFRASSDLFTSAQLISSQPYLADFNLLIEPSIKIYEVPLYSKTFQILDHPLQAPDFYTYQRMDNSQVIGFLLNLEAFVPNTFPHTITKSDIEYKNQYLNANDLLETDQISLPCRSRPNKVDVFRKRTKPLFINDYDDSNFIDNKGLDIDDYYMLSNCVYEEKVHTNTKLYYVLRFASQNNTIGQLTAVIEAELINDGGYKYSVFKQYFEDDFKEMVAKAASEQFKKLFQISPTISQIELKTGDIDYSMKSHEAMQKITVGSAADTIFDKTFKIRLTSKKTGKKIDLNVTYRLREESL